MADRIFPQINANIVDPVQRMSNQIERIESTVSSTDRDIRLMTTKLDNLISLLERRQFLEDPSRWVGGQVSEDNWAHKGMLTSVEFPHAPMYSKAALQELP